MLKWPRQPQYPLLQKLMPCRKRLLGFTFIELMVTLAILGVLASAAYPMAKLSVQRNKEQELKQALRQIRTAIDSYKQAADEGQISRASNASGYPLTLESLVNGVENTRDPEHRKIYFMSRLPRDPFANSSLSAAETWGKRSYASPPDGPAEGEDVFDVYSKAEGTGINGIPYQAW